MGESKEKEKEAEKRKKHPKGGSSRWLRTRHRIRKKLLR